MVSNPPAVAFDVEEAINAVSAWWSKEPSQPIALPSFLTDPIANGAASELEAKRWQPKFMTLDEAGDVATVSAEEYARTERRRRYLRCDVMDVEEMRSSPNCGLILDLLNGGWLWEFVTEATKLSLQREPWTNASRYRRGAFLGGHNDVHDDRVIGAILYLNQPDFHEGAGGEFFMVTPGAKPKLSEPRHNSLSFIPMRDQIFHGVTPIRSATFVRHAFAIHFQATATA